jgi:hypothetical protein
MSRHISVRVRVLLVLVLAGAVACGGSTQPPAAQGEATATASTTPKAAGEILKQMDNHFAKVHEIEEAAIRGDLASMKAPAQALAQLPAGTGLPSGTEIYVADMKRSAEAVAAAQTLPNAAAATATMVSTCGTCHVVSMASPKFPAVTAPVMIPGTASHMSMHQFAVDLLYQGLATPSDDQWKKGAEAMKASPLANKDLPKDSTLTKEIVAAEARVHELADRAGKAGDQGAKVAIYGELVGSCASCHSLHGREWGPGLPQTPAK